MVLRTPHDTNRLVHTTYLSRYIYARIAVIPGLEKDRRPNVANRGFALGVRGKRTSSSNWNFHSRNWRQFWCQKSSIRARRVKIVAQFCRQARWSKIRASCRSSQSGLDVDTPRANQRVSLPGHQTSPFRARCASMLGSGVGGLGL